MNAIAKDKDDGLDVFSIEHHGEVTLIVAAPALENLTRRSSIRRRKS